MSRDERIAKVDNPSFRAVDQDTVRTLMRRVPKRVEPAQRLRIAPPEDLRPTVEVDGADHLVRERLDDSLHRDPFLRQLRRERLRVDRTKTHLSLVLFRFEGDAKSESDSVQRLFNLLHDTRRETDMLGRLSNDLVGALLPDTDENGAKVFRERVVCRLGAMSFRTIVETYPDHLFDNLLSGIGAPTDHDHLLHDDSGLQRNSEDFLKRAFDIVFSAILLVAASPLMLVTAIATKLTSPGPVIFKQVRLGNRGVPFQFYKFRSMRCDANDQIHREYVTSLIKGGHEKLNQQNANAPLFKIKSDPRVTVVGRFIRQTSIDELPQLFNVLKGDMSLVGPRPPLPYEAVEYQSWHLRRILEIRPGITGLWQVEGRSRVSFDEMVRMDLAYIKNRTLYYDLKILIRTVKVVLWQDGAQ